MLIIAYPRSGSNWLCYLLADCLQVPFANKSFSSSTLKRELEGANIDLTEMIAFEPVPYILRRHTEHPNLISANRDGKAVYLVRDGRDVMISHYFYQFSHVAHKKWPWYQRLLFDVRRKLTGGIDAHLSSFIQGDAPAWKSHVENWLFLSPAPPVVTYESLNADPVGTLTNLFEELRSW